MAIFDFLQNLIGGATDSAQGAAGDIIGGLADNQVLQDATDLTGAVTDNATEIVSAVAEQGQTAVEDITGKLGL